MKQLIIFSTLSYLLFTINTSAANQSLNESLEQKENILKIGVLLPLSGKFQNIGESFLKSIQLALFEVGNKNIKIYPRDSKANALDAYDSAREFEEMGINIVLGPIFYESIVKLKTITSITFISFTNKATKIPKNIIAFGVSVDSQIAILKEYFNKIEASKTLLLSPNSEFEQQSESIEKQDILKFYRTYSYDTNPKKITAQIEKITKYQERKRDLERRKKILEKSDLYKDKNELKRLEQKHTLGKVNFDSVVILDFGERLKSVLSSFMFSDVTSKEVNFFALNQWFDETLFNENAMQNLYFPSIDHKNLNKFNKKYEKAFGEKPNKVSILAYDALGLIYYCWYNNNKDFNISQLYNKNGFKGLHGKFVIKNNFSKQNLKIYKVSNKKFIKVY